MATFGLHVAPPVTKRESNLQSYHTEINETDLLHGRRKFMVFP
jgi:hypothetical protein